MLIAAIAAMSFEFMKCVAGLSKPSKSPLSKGDFFLPLTRGIMGSKSIPKPFHKTLNLIGQFVIFQFDKLLFLLNIN
ncbi:MAG: hypothetical protein R3C26_13950 [Calditrichia bacterium]